ncbi:MAG: helix-turn-helix domain-containing protein [Veillonellaceae bacterium]|nr:helix-turn-helix domain-containing protein [Veillonellaceae bacterium]MDY4485554.1 helix-turn-helix domain-containing protein [Anaerovibrio sp.]
MVISKETIKARELFSKRLSTLLNTHNMNQNELAKILNVSESTVGKWVLGKSMPRTMGIIQTIADNFGVGKSFLLEETPVEDTPTPAYYLDPETAEMAEELHKRKDMRMLFHAAKSSTPEDVKMVTDMLERFKNS